MSSQQSLPLNVDDLRLYHHYITVATLTFEDDAMMDSRSFASLHVLLATVPSLADVAIIPSLNASAQDVDRPLPQPRRGNAALMSNDDGEATQHFYTSETGEKWTRWVAQVDVCTQNRFHRRFKAPKGLDEIREKNDYGVTVENMILSPFFNWRRQGNQNYHPTKLDPYAKNGDKSASSQIPFSVGLNHPGAIPIPACDIKTAWQNIDNWWRDPSKAPCEYYPCCSY
ncbi:hypothetical protein ACKAV7_011704 [Fusarium commune]